MKSEKEEIILDATGKSFGRLASKIAYYLQGKHRPDYDPSKDRPIFVVVKNLAKVRFSGQKLETKVYRWHTVYIGHLKELKLEEMWQKNPIKVLQLAVKGMLPKNKLSKRRLLRLKASL